ncbi:MAG: 3'-5' exonuclease [Candidatus Saccharicenans sp.]
MEFIPVDSEQSSEETNDSAEDSRPKEEIGTDQETRVKKRIQELVLELLQRGYRYSDLAILTYRNETVAEISAWLNEKAIPFVPFSSLDIRKRPIIREILSFLQFLDFPLDDLNFSAFILGQLFQKKIKTAGFEAEAENFREFILSSRSQPRTSSSPLYTLFRKSYPELWENFFEAFFKSVGYLPLYDLVSQVYRSFDLLSSFPDEQAALIRLLEVIKHFEGEGKSNLRDFISFTESPSEEQSIWTVDVPEEIPAVRIMTIHKAKGLGFPVVILLLYPQPYQSPVFYLSQTGQKEESGEMVEVLKLNESLISASPELQRFYQEHRLREEVNRLNTLYVALTRAREELYIIGVPGKRKIYPFDFLEAIGFNLEQKYKSSPVKPDRKGRRKIREESKKPSKKPEKEVSLTVLPTQGLQPAPETPSFSYQDQKLGTLVHALLAEIEYLESGLDQIFDRVLKKPIFREYAPSEIDWAVKKVKRLLSQPGPAEYFKFRPGRKIFREIDLVNPSGQLFRADRVVLDPDCLTLIDFKTNQPKDPQIKESYFNQMRNYRLMLEDLFPGKKPISLLMYLDQGTMELVP